MSDKLNTTTSSGAVYRKRIILCMALMMALIYVVAGCSSSSYRASGFDRSLAAGNSSAAGSSAPSHPPASAEVGGSLDAAPSSNPDQAAAPEEAPPLTAMNEPANSSEPTGDQPAPVSPGPQGDQGAPGEPGVEELSAPPADAGAEALVASILENPESISPAPDSSIRIRLGLLRNQSRAGHDDFVSAVTRMVRLLDQAGAKSHVAFIADARAPADYELGGAVYLLRVDGGDCWELYLSLHKPGDNSALWRADGPARMPRDPQPGEPQIVYPVIATR